ncbi:sensor histidine kinase [Ferruginibacter sp. SUN002]|uniref:sensor histidine kinase n=1 Tax=Ferruginibacter sp. SUN002 TaxID=2937789 RepID=UPI003D35F6D0
MTALLLHKFSKPKQYIISGLLVLAVTIFCHFLSTYIGYRVIAFILLITISLLAVVFDILPVLLSAVLTALIWNFFFIPPHFTFRIDSTEDRILFLMYFIIALVNAALTYKIRQIEKIAAQKEEKANTIKLYNTLLNSLSHELRTPIATIIAATDNLQTNSKNLSLLQNHELIDEISKASFRLNNQVDNLLNMSRIDSGIIQPKKDWCDIEELIYSTVKKVEENSSPLQKITVNINPSIPFFKIDKGILEQVVYNILNNAVLYTAPNCRIDIVALCHTDLLQIIIEDNGEGFPTNEISNVFNKFYRLNNSKPGGTGLGLSIVKGFTEAMGGSVHLENTSTGGARFTISIAAETSYLKNLKNE